MEAEINALFTPTGPSKTDPILGTPPLQFVIWNSFIRKHGTFIERVLISTIRQVGDWGDGGQENFEWVEDEDGTHLIDRIVISPDESVVLLIECKRNLGNLDGDAKKKILAYSRWCQDNADVVAKKLGLDLTRTVVRFAVFDAYGIREDRGAFPDVPIIMPEDLERLFGKRVATEYRQVEESVKAAATGKGFREEVAEMARQNYPPTEDTTSNMPDTEMDAGEFQEPFNKERFNKMLDDLLS